MYNPILQLCLLLLLHHITHSWSLSDNTRLIDIVSCCRGTRNPKNTSQHKVKQFFTQTLLHLSIYIQYLCIYCVCCRAKGRDCQWLLEDGVGAAVLYHRYGNTLWRRKPGKTWSLLLCHIHFIRYIHSHCGLVSWRMLLIVKMYQYVTDVLMICQIRSNVRSTGRLETVRQRSLRSLLWSWTQRTTAQITPSAISASLMWVHWIN